MNQIPGKRHENKFKLIPLHWLFPTVNMADRYQQPVAHPWKTVEIRNSNIYQCLFVKVLRLLEVLLHTSKTLFLASASTTLGCSVLLVLRGGIVPSEPPKI